MSREPRSWAASILGFALAVLAACWALNMAARLIVAVLPILVGLAVAATIGFGALRLLQRR